MKSSSTTRTVSSVVSSGIRVLDRDGQPRGEDRALVIVHRHRAAPSLADDLDQRESDAAPAGVAGLGAEAALEDLVDPLTGHAGPGVGHLDHGGVAVGGETYVD